MRVFSVDTQHIVMATSRTAKNFAEMERILKVFCEVFECDPSGCYTDYWSPAENRAWEDVLSFLHFCGRSDREPQLAKTIINVNSGESFTLIATDCAGDMYRHFENGESTTILS